jgi:hypothetical protein
MLSGIGHGKPFPIGAFLLPGAFLFYTVRRMSLDSLIAFYFSGETIISHPVTLLLI